MEHKLYYLQTLIGETCPSVIRDLHACLLESACQQWGAMYHMNKLFHGKCLLLKRTLSTALLSLL
jgi:hypothetical protein